MEAEINVGLSIIKIFSMLTIKHKTLVVHTRFNKKYILTTSFVNRAEILQSQEFDTVSVPTN